MRGRGEVSNPTSFVRQYLGRVEIDLDGCHAEQTPPPEGRCFPLRPRSSTCGKDGVIVLCRFLE